jgi:elongation factor Ts
VIGENISIRRAIKLSTKGLVIAEYVHPGSRIAVVVSLKGGDSVLARQIAMHVAATNPKAISSKDLPKELVDKEAAVLREKAMQSGKPEAIIEKMVEGGLRNFYKESCLLEQSYVIKPDLTVAEVLKQANAELVYFVCFVLGEGFEKKSQNFAEEVAATLAQTQGQA